MDTSTSATVPTASADAPVSTASDSTTATTLSSVESRRQITDGGSRKRRSRPQDSSSSSSSSSPTRRRRRSNDDNDFLLLTPLEAGFPAVPRNVSAGSWSLSSSSPLAVEYIGRPPAAARSLLAAAPPIALLLDDDEEQAPHESSQEDDDDEDLELASLFVATRRPLPSVKLQPRTSQRERFYQDYHHQANMTHQDLWATL